MALKGIRVVEMAGLAPAPFCGMILADFGAKVTRIDRAPKKDQTVIVNMDTLARGKQSVSVDLKKPEGVEVVRKLCSKADVIIEPFRKGVMEKLGLGPEVLLGVNPRLVYARLTGFGQNGPLSHKAGHDINYIAISGVLSQLGRKHENPAPPINLAADFAGGGLTCALGIALALYERTMSGKGQVIDANMVNGSAYLSTFLWTSRAMPMIWGNGRGENRLDGGSAFYETYKTKDGKYVSVGALEPQFYADLLTAMDVIRAASSLEDLRSRCGLKFPDRIYATNLRKHCATIAQVIGLKDHEMKWLCRHLGHTRKVHEQHYRSTSGLIERLDIAKLMLIQESNLHGKFSGKSLNEISFEDLAVEDYMNDDGVDILQTRKKVKKRLGLTKKDVPQLSDPEAMKEKFTEIFLTKTRDEWTEIFKDLDACFAPILEMDEAPGHPHNVETQTFISSVDGKVEPAPAPKLSRTPGVGRVLAQPEVGEHTVSRLLEDGFSKAEVDNLIKSGVLFQNNDMSKL